MRLGHLPNPNITYTNSASWESYIDVLLAPFYIQPQALRHRASTPSRTYFESSNHLSDFMNLLETSIKALEIAKLTTSGIPIPWLSTAIECALSILKKAKDIEDTWDDCRILAERAAALMMAVYQQLRHGSSDTGVKEHAMTFLQNLIGIEILMDRRLRAGKRERILFAFRRGKIAREVKTLTTSLEDSYRIFMIQAALDNDRAMNTLASGNIRMLQHIDDSARVREVVLGDTKEIRTGLSDLTHHVRGIPTLDGNFRFFARENLAFLEPIADSYYNNRYYANTPRRDACTLVQATAQSRTGRIVRYRAIVEAAGNLTGTHVVVYVYPNRDDQRFVDAIKFAKQTCHPYVLAMLGYSRPADPGEAAYIVMEDQYLAISRTIVLPQLICLLIDYIPFTQYVSSLHGTRKLRELLRMNTAICMAAHHLEAMELPQLLPTYTLWDTSSSHNIGLDELVFDYRHGGLIKWARNPLAQESTDPDESIDIPSVQTSRRHMTEDLRAVACARIDIVMQRWLSQILSLVGAYSEFFLGRIVWQYWQHIVDDPWGRLGVWLGRNSSYEDWICLTAQNPGFDVAVTMQAIPRLLPDPMQEGRGFWQRVTMGEWHDIPESDHDEMRIEFELSTGGDRTRWKRYQFTSIPVNTTLLFQQRVRALDGSDACSCLVRVLPDPSIVGHYACIGTVIHRNYYTETTVTMIAHGAEQKFRPLWFFVLQFGGGDGSAHDRNTPCGFWSSEKYPTSIPTGIIFDPSPQFEPIEMGESEAPLFTSIQILGDLVFTTRTKMLLEIVQLTVDELSTFRELQESRYLTSNANASGSDDSGTDDMIVDDSNDEGNKYCRL